jgi:hypothetical protein
MRYIVWILGILVIVACAYWIYSKEGFQVRLLTKDEIMTNFWYMSEKIDSNDALTVLDVNRVSKPDSTDKKDKMPIEFSKYISIYALAKYNDVSGARIALFNDYDTLQTEMSRNLHDQKSITDWGTDPKTNTCNQLDSIRKTFLQKLFNLRSQVQDLSGTSILASSMRDENLAFQEKYKSVCTGTPLSPACVQLANQEGPVFSLLAKYENVNNNIFYGEYDISYNLQTLNDTYRILQCDRTLKSSFFREKGTIQVFYFDINTMTKYAVTDCSLVCGMNLCSSVVEINKDEMNLINKYTMTLIEKSESSTGVKTTAVKPFTCDMLYDGMVVKRGNETTTAETASVLNKLYYIKNGKKYFITNCSLCNLDFCSHAKTIHSSALASISTSSTDFACNLLPPQTTQSSLNSAGNISYISDTNTGTIDTTTLLAKLQQLSPYYLSPDILQYITSSIISSADTQSTVSTTSDILINISKIINNIKILTTGV